MHFAVDRHSVEARVFYYFLLLRNILSFIIYFYFLGTVYLLFYFLIIYVVFKCNKKAEKTAFYLCYVCLHLLNFIFTFCCLKEVFRMFALSLFFNHGYMKFCCFKNKFSQFSGIYWFSLCFYCFLALTKIVQTYIWYFL